MLTKDNFWCFLIFRYQWRYPRGIWVRYSRNVLLSTLVIDCSSKYLWTLKEHFTCVINSRRCQKLCEKRADQKSLDRKESGKLWWYLSLNRKQWKFRKGFETSIKLIFQYYYIQYFMLFSDKTQGFFLISLINALQS